MSTSKVPATLVSLQDVPSTPKKNSRKQKPHHCPVCEGTGRLSKKELARYRQCVRMANVVVQQVNDALSDFTEYVSGAESLMLNKNDQEFLSGLKISPK